ncbi:uncharacterized protein UV8b_05456 [Ustilaginoidea virens]|uniref:Mediator of RNA polymerase II transcription subunit 8 n=1 Tax=Ustilaginoidea virens TaxID=1159556 RepID=A0A8E5MI44_USTVR|nr:uncharacterized protein UV8b_05456 [Ustilaginoidea virens]QUC21213.1 hypothetical protein UV8b_05456 [Ustilaginoidea virens]
MATLGLDDDELKSVEHMVARLAQLSSSIQSLKLDILKSNPLPHPSSLQASAQIIQRNLQSVLDSLNANSDLFTRMAVRPSTNYPGRTQENILTQLLRKKLEPDVEELVLQGRETAKLATAEGVAELQSIWEELREWTHGRIAAYVRDEAGDVYTKEERNLGVQNVRTGLKRALDDESDDDDDDDDGDDDDDDGGDDDADGKDEVGDGDGNDDAKDGEAANKGAEPETLLWFAARGDFEVPRNVEFERKLGIIKRGLEGVNIPPRGTEMALS